MLDLEPRKQPRQRRACANVDAILDATAHLLRESGWAALTTNHIAERAGVSIGTLYQFFPGKEAVVATLARRATEKHLEKVLADLPEALARRKPEAVLELLIGRIADALSADRRLYAVLLRDVPFLREPGVTSGPVDAIAALVRDRFAALLRRRRDEDFEIEGWLVGRMAYEAIVAVAVFGEGPASPPRTLAAFLRLLMRMLGVRS